MTVSTTLKLSGTQAGKRLAFYADARQSLAEYEKTGISYRAEDVHRYFLARASGKQARKPRPLKR